MDRSGQDVIELPFNVALPAGKRSFLVFLYNHRSYILIFMHKVGKSKRLARFMVSNPIKKGCYKRVSFYLSHVAKVYEY